MKIPYADGVLVLAVLFVLADMCRWFSIAGPLCAFIRLRSRFSFRFVSRLACTYCPAGGGINILYPHNEHCSQSGPYGSIQSCLRYISSMHRCLSPLHCRQAADISVYTPEHIRTTTIQKLKTGAVIESLKTVIDFVTCDTWLQTILCSTTAVMVGHVYVTTMSALTTLI